MGRAVSKIRAFRDAGGFKAATEAAESKGNILSKLMELNRGAQKMRVGDVHRIIAQPIEERLSAGEVEEISRQKIEAVVFEEGFRLHEVQARAIRDFEAFGKGFHPVPVGWGKTIISLVCAAIAYRQGERRTLLMVPPKNLDELVRINLPTERRRFNLSIPFHIIGGQSPAKRKRIASAKRPGCYIFTYSLLSSRDGYDLLEEIDPGLLILDEAHEVKNRTAARTRRLLHYIRDKSPRLVLLSGTLSNRSVMDYHHLITPCLGQGSPLPLSPQQASDWAAIIDADADPNQSSGRTGPLKPLLDWAREHFPEMVSGEQQEDFRRAYQMRMKTMPCVVSSYDQDIPCSLVISPKTKRQTPSPRLKELMRKVEKEWLTPAGDEIEHAIHTFKWLNELSAGFYHNLRWPTEKEVCQSNDCDIYDARELLQLALDHHAAAQNYAREFRDWYKRKSRPGLDTPFLVGGEMERYGAKSVGPRLYDAWRNMKDKERDDLPERISEPVLVDDYKIVAALDWARKLGSGVIWVWHEALGRWTHERLVAAGIDALHCPASANATKMMLDPENANKIAVASIASHGSGSNLQHWANQHVMQWPRSAKVAEQLLGRLHRVGQQADEVDTTYFDWTLFDELLMAACINDAVFIQQTTGNRQKLIFATYEKIPRIATDVLLRERGFQTRILNQVQKKEMAERFGAASLDDAMESSR